jgi:hypothetical protein
MPIDFKQQTFFDPKIDIIGKEVPVADIEKTANVIQDRYDKSLENETKSLAIAKKLQQSVSSRDKELAAQILADYQGRLEERAKKGNYADMGWQTAADALDVAGLHEGLTNKAKKEEASLAEIAKKNISNPERMAFEQQNWLGQQETPTWDNKNRILTGLNLTAPKVVEDQDMAKLVNNWANDIESNIVGKGNKTEKFFKQGDKLPNGQLAVIPGIYNLGDSRNVETVTGDRVEDIVKNYAEADPTVRAYKDALTRFYSTKMDPKAAALRAEEETIGAATRAAKTKYAFSKDVRTNELGLDVPGTGLIGGGPIENPGDLYTPSSVNVQDFQGQSQLTDDIKEGLQGDATKFDKIAEKAEALKYKYRDNPMQRMKADGMIKTADALKDLTTKYPSVVEGLYGLSKGTTEIWQSTFSKLGGTAEMYKNQVINNPGGTTKLLGVFPVNKSGSPFSDKEKKEISQLLDIVSKNGNDLIGWSSAIDNTNEDNYENFKTETGKTIPMATFDLNSEKQRNAKNSLATDLNVSDFRILGKKDFKFDTGAKITIQKFATEALGGGEGTIYEAIIKDNDGVEHAINVAPKNKTTGKTLNKQMSKYVYKPLHFNDMLSKGTSFYEDGQFKTIGNILKANRNGELNSLFENVNKNAKITYKDNAYYLEGNNNPFTSVSQLLYSLKDNNKYNNMIQ